MLTISCIMTVQNKAGLFLKSKSHRWSFKEFDRGDHQAPKRKVFKHGYTCIHKQP